MAEQDKKKFETDFGELGFFLFLTATVVMFWGDPDIADALIQYLQAGAKCHG